jgi:hypothetical protein
MMNKEKQIEEMSCKKCLHYEMCLDNFRGAKEEGLWELTEEDEYFAHADECDFYAAGYRKQSEGYWFFTEYEYFTCSNCGKSHFNFCDSSAEARKRLAEGEYYPYCPECGAKMKGGTE